MGMKRSGKKVALRFGFFILFYFFNWNVKWSTRNLRDPNLSENLNSSFFVLSKKNWSLLNWQSSQWSYFYNGLKFKDCHKFDWGSFVDNKAHWNLWCPYCFVFFVRYYVSKLGVSVAAVLHWFLFIFIWTPTHSLCSDHSRSCTLIPV